MTTLRLRDSKFGGVSEQRKEEVERDVNIELFYKHVLNHKEETELRFIDSKNKKPAFSRFCSNLDEVKCNCLRYDGKYNIYSGVNERSKGGKKDKDVLSISCLFFDADAHNGESIENARRDVYSLIHNMEGKFGSLRYFVVFTGHGYALYVPINAISTEYTNGWRRLSEYLCAAATDGFGTGTFDTAVWNISRVMRVPGTLNIKSDPIRSFIYDSNFPANPQNDRVSRMTKAMGKKTFKEEEEEAEEEEKENRKDHTNAKANNANFSKNNKDGEGKREENHTGDSNFDKCLQYLCEWLIEGIHDPRAPHEVRREIVTRMNLALMRDGVETKKRGKIIFNFLKKNVAWSDYDDRTTAYQVDHIVKNGYNPSNCKKTNCPFKKSCKRRNFWRKDKKEKKEKRKSRFKKGEESFKERRYKSVIDLLPNGNGESIIDVRHLGAGKSTEAREAYDEGVFVYKTIKERDEACARDKNMTPVFSRFEGNKSPDPPDPIKEPLAYLRWEEDEEEKKYFGDVRDNYLCHFKDEIGSNIGGGSRPASCGTCPYCPDKNGNANDPGVEPCKYPPYAKEVLSGEYGKYAVSNKMSHAKAFQKKHGPIVIDDTSVTDLVIDKKVAAKKQLEKSLNILFGEDGVIQKNMEDIWRGEIKKALDGGEESFKNVESKIDEIEYYRDRCIFSGGTIPINIAYLGTAFYYFKTYDSEKEEEKYIFCIENDSPLHKVKYDSENRPINGELKILRYLSSTPAVADAFFLRMYYP